MLYRALPVASLLLALAGCGSPAPAVDANATAELEERLERLERQLRDTEQKLRETDDKLQGVVTDAERSRQKLDEAAGLVDKMGPRLAHAFRHVEIWRRELDYNATQRFGQLSKEEQERDIEIFERAKRHGAQTGEDAVVLRWIGTANALEMAQDYDARKLKN